MTLLATELKRFNDNFEKAIGLFGSLIQGQAITAYQPDTSEAIKAKVETNIKAKKAPKEEIKAPEKDKETEGLEAEKVEKPNEKTADVTEKEQTAAKKSTENTAESTPRVNPKANKPLDPAKLEKVQAIAKAERGDSISETSEETTAPVMTRNEFQPYCLKFLSFHSAYVTGGDEGARQAMVKFLAPWGYSNFKVIPEKELPAFAKRIDEYIAAFAKELKLEESL